MYERKKPIARTGRPIMCASDFEGHGARKHLRHGQQPEGEPGIKGQPTLHPFWAAGFSFARGHFVIQVPYDQYLPMVFQGEEISIGMRAFTHGYDFYAGTFGSNENWKNKKKKDAIANLPSFLPALSSYPFSLSLFLSLSMCVWFYQ